MHTMDLLTHQSTFIRRRRKEEESLLPAVGQLGVQLPEHGVPDGQGTLATPLARRPRRVAVHRDGAGGGVVLCRAPQGQRPHARTFGLAEQPRLRRRHRLRQRPPAPPPAPSACTAAAAAALRVCCKRARRVKHIRKLLLLQFTGPPVPLTARTHSTPQRARRVNVA
eukprot:6483301-Pyramimonas_sp.AAC.1